MAYRPPAPGTRTADDPDPNCSCCQGRGWIDLMPAQSVLDFHKQRYPWAGIGIGVNDCPACVQLPPLEPAHEQAE